MTMPQGPTGIESVAWGVEWLTTPPYEAGAVTASAFHDRTRNAVETHYKTTLTGNATTSALQPWTTAKDALFTTLMSGFASINAFISMLSGAIAGVVGGTLTTIANFMTGLVTDVGRLLTNLLNAANEFIGDIGKGIVDGVVTVAGWLNNLWMTLTGQTGTGKKVSDVSTALSTVTSNANSGFQIAGTARDNLQITWNELYDGFDGTTTPTGTARTPAEVRGRGASVRASSKIGEGYYLAGANILINPGFDDPAFAILNSGVAVTANVATGDVVRSGTRSLKLVASASAPYSMLAANTTSQVHLPCSVGETYYLEAWVYGKATNTQVTAAGGIIMGIQVYTAAKAFITNVSVNFTAGTALNSNWTKISGKVTVPAPTPVGPPEGPRAVFFTPYIQLNTSITAGHTYYFDDVVVREITDAQAASTAAGTADSKAVTAQNTVDLRSRDFSNLVVGSDFDAVTQPWTLTTGLTISTAQKNSGTQSMQIVGTAAAYPFVPYNNYQTFEAKPGEKFYMECWVRKSSTYVGGDTSGPRLLMVRGNGVNANQPIDSRYLRSSDIAAADTWQKLSLTTVAVPSDTSSVYFALAGMPANAAGSLWVDDIVVRRVVAGDTIADDAITTAKIADGAVTAAAVTDGALTQAKVAGLPDPLLPVSQTLIDHSTAILDLKADREVTVNQGRTMSISFTQLANANDLPTTGTQTWSTQYLTGSGPTFGITSGKAAWKGSGTRSAKVLYRGAAGRTLISTGTGGSFTLTFGATTTAAIAYNATQATVQTALGANAVVTGTNALTGLTITPVSTFSGALSINAALVTGGTATLSDGIDSTLTDYQSLRGALADPPSIFGVESSGFTALARVSQDGNSYVFARAYWPGGSLDLKGKIGYVNNGVETVWQDNIPLTWSTELTFRLGVDDNPRAYQVFSGTTLVVRYDEGYANFGAFPAGVAGRTYVDNTGNRLTVTGTGGTFTLTVLGIATTGPIAFGAARATVETSLNAALNTAYLTTGITYATVTGTAANTAGTNGGLVVTFNTKVKGQTPGNTNMSVNPALLTGGTATVANRYTWSSGTGFVPSAATTGVGAASPLGVGNRRFGAEVRTVGSNNSGTISSVAVTDNPPVVYAGSVARMSRLNTANVGSLSTTDTALPNNFFDDVEFESLDIDANLTLGSFTVTKSKMYLINARVKLKEGIDANSYLNLQKWTTGTALLVQRGGSLWAADTGNFARNPTSGFVMTATWLQYLEAGASVRLSANCDRNSYTTPFTGAWSETYFTISALQ